MHTMWKGSISFGLVHIPIKLFAATEDKNIKLRYLHKECSTPIKYERVCPHCDREVENEEIVRGYEYESGKFVTLDKDELEELKKAQNKSVEIIDFVKLEEIDPIYFNRSYFIGPNENGGKAYALLQKAMKDSGKIGLAKLTMHSKEHLAAVRVYDKGLLLETIYYPDEIRNIDHVPGIDEKIELNQKELDTATQLIEQLTTEFDPEKYEDEYRNALSELIEAKVSGNEVKTAKKTKKNENVVDLMAALQASIDETKPKKKKKASGTKKGATAGKKSSTGKKATGTKKTTKKKASG
ncbi:MAG TPA: Ku protein [Bacillales bacterium]|nr:Ku protein [Bacillales bacterium]